MKYQNGDDLICSTGIAKISIGAGMDKHLALTSASTELEQQFLFRPDSSRYKILRKNDIKLSSPELISKHLFVAHDENDRIVKITWLVEGNQDEMAAYLDKALNQSHVNWHSTYDGAEARKGYIWHTEEDITFSMARFPSQVFKNLLMIEVFANDAPEIILNFSVIPLGKI